MVDRVGQQLGNYRLVSLLGQGGYAEVYLGQHVRFKQQAAIKVLHAHLSELEAEHFQQEAETIATLAHPGIIRVLDFDVQDGIPFLVMDYAQGGSLRQRYPKGSLVPLPVIVSVVKQGAEALQYAHEQKFIHRDVKPENMLVGKRQEILLSDFGIATIAHSTSSLSTSAEGTSGTLAYMAPEQIEGHPRPASDQYALGVVVYEWLCGERPFEGSVSELIAQQLSMPPPPLRERVPAIPAGVEQVVLRALAKDPKQRFASVQDFTLALEEATREESSGRTLVELSTDHSPKDGFKSNLPAQLTPLLGREQEVAEACDLIRRPEVRLLTLTGTGGIGKTRLGLQFATDLLEDFVDGVCFVPLAPISDPKLVVPTIAQVLGVQESGAQPLVEIVKAWLRDKHFLLLLDNFEQIVSAAPLLEDLLVACPRLVILVTSREVLGLSAEHLFPVTPLSLPDLAQLPDHEQLAQCAAVSLFLQRVQALKPGFQLNPTNALTIAEICVQLDGLPLAIELAAARIRLLPPQALLARLSQRLQVLTGGARTLPTRQKTLRNTLQWSYDLLTEQEQRLFRHLSVFVGGCTLEGVEAVCADPGNETANFLDGVASLIDKSLLLQTDQEREEPRLAMLETIRQYGLECLTTQGEREVTQEAHAAYYLRLAETATVELIGPQQAVWYQRLEDDHDNLRAALQYLLEREEGERALRLCNALYWFWVVHRHHNEGRAVFERTLATCAGITEAERAKALCLVGHLAMNMGDFDRAEELCREGLALFQEIGDRKGVGEASFHVGHIVASKDQLVVARPLFEESLAISREVGNRIYMIWSLFWLANVTFHLGEYMRGLSLAEESLALFREDGHTEAIATNLGLLAEMHLFSQGDLVKAWALAKENLMLAKEIGDKDSEGFALSVLGLISLHQGNMTRARSLFEENLALWKEEGDKLGLSRAITFLARVEAREGHYAAARAYYEESLAILKDAYYKWYEFDMSAFLEGLASVLAAQGEYAGAARTLGAAEVLREVVGVPIPPVERDDYEHTVAAVRTHVGEQAFAAAWTQGRDMTLEQVFNEALKMNGKAEKQ